MSIYMNFNGETPDFNQTRRKTITITFKGEEFEIYKKKELTIDISKRLFWEKIENVIFQDKSLLLKRVLTSPTRFIKEQFSLVKLEPPTINFIAQGGSGNSQVYFLEGGETLLQGQFDYSWDQNKNGKLTGSTDRICSYLNSFGNRLNPEGFTSRADHFTLMFTQTATGLLSYKTFTFKDLTFNFTVEFPYTILEYKIIGNGSVTFVPMGFKESYNSSTGNYQIVRNNNSPINNKEGSPTSKVALVFDNTDVSFFVKVTGEPDRGNRLQYFTNQNNEILKPSEKNTLDFEINLSKNNVFKALTYVVAFTPLSLKIYLTEGEGDNKKVREITPSIYLGNKPVSNIYLRDSEKIGGLLKLY